MALSNGSDRDGKLIEFFVRALEAHEKEIDRLICELESVNIGLVAATQRLNSKIEKIGQRLDELHIQIGQLKK